MDFERRKERVMGTLARELRDKSRKGGVDEAIAGLISRVNSHPHFYTTSSCSGRTSILTTTTRRKGGEWLYVSHDVVAAEEIVKALAQKLPPCKEDCSSSSSSSSSSAAAAAAEEEELTVLRFEPFILAVECATLSIAEALVSCGISSGFRESGVTAMGKRIMVAIRCSIRMEVPIAERGRLLVSFGYIRFLVTIANKKMMENRQRTNRFFSDFIERFEGRSGQLIEKTYQRGPYDRSAVLSKQLAESLVPGRRKRNYHKQSSPKPLSELGNLLPELEKLQMDILSRIASVETMVKNNKSIITESKKRFKYALPLDSSTLKMDENTYLRMSELNNTVVKGKKFDTALLKRPKRCCHSGDRILNQRLCLPVAERGACDELSKRLCRWGHSACALPSTNDQPSSQLLIFGGYGGPGRHTRKNDLLLFDCKISTLTEIYTKNAPSPRMGHTASIVGMKMVVIGGREDPGRVLNDVCVFNLETMQWEFPRVIGARFPPRHRHAAAAIGGNIYIFGGLNDMVVLGNLFVLDVDRMHWSYCEFVGEIPSPRYSLALAAVDKKIYLFGGSDGKSLFGGIHVFDVERGTCMAEETTGRMPLARFSHCMISFNRFLLLIGGCPVSKQVNQLFFLDVNSLVWKDVHLDLSDGHLLVRHTVNLLENHLVIIGGGISCYAFGTKFSPPCAVGLHWLSTSNAENGEVFEQNVYGRPDCSLGQCALKFMKKNAKKAKDTLKMLNWLDLTRKPKVSEDGSTVIFPVTQRAFCQLQVLLGMKERKFGGLDSLDIMLVEGNKISQSYDMMCAIASEASFAAESLTVKQTQTCQKTLRNAISSLLIKYSLPLVLLSELPKRWERLGDIAILPANSFKSCSWDVLGCELWKVVAQALCVERIAQQAPIAATKTRDSNLELLLGNDGWVNHRENGIIYSFDATKCMYSSGNVSEKLRMARMKCDDEIVLDLFAGIGYFSLPFLVKAGAKKLYACEMNPHALAALHYNLYANKVADRCVVLEGDNQITAPKAVVDRVCLGLLPTSENSWHVAVKALRPEGGVLHIHGNVKDTEEEHWLNYVQTSIESLAKGQGRIWAITIEHVERVKWYAPHIRHLVADVKCQMLADS